MPGQHVVTLANSIVGVSVLAMPFCFKQCGVILATLILILGAIMTRMICHFLLKGSIITRRRTYELLAFHTFGQAGKFLVEITIIGYLVGTLIAFLVVMGDLGPQILVEIFPIENNTSLRTVVMSALAIFVALPLGLLRNIDSLSSVSTASVLFYLFLVGKLFSESVGPLWEGSYLDKINYWRPAGVLQCIPIFSMALSCQTQVHGIYDILPEPSMQKMNEVVKKAVYICTGFYICVGFLGYVAFCSQYFGGNVLLNFGPTWSTQLIKMCFVLSIAFSFPIVILPCRASLHSLIFKGHSHHNVHDISTNYIPESRIRILTVAIVGVTLVLGLLIPNIELVLGLVGSTCGSIICIICPTVMFIRVTSKNTTERLLAQTVLFAGVLIMVLTTYVTLYAVEHAQNDPLTRTTEILQEIRRGENKADGIVSSGSGIQKLSSVDVELPPIILLDGKEGPGDVKSYKFVDKPPVTQDDKSKVPKVISAKDKIDADKKDLPAPAAPAELSPNKDEGQDVAVERPDKAQSAKTDEKVKETKAVPPEVVQEPKLDVETFAKGPEVDKNVPPPIKQSELPALPPKVESPVQVVQQKPLGEKQDTIGEKESLPVEPVKKEFVPEEFLKKLEEQNAEQKKLIEQQKEILAKFEQHHAEDLKREKEAELPAPVPPNIQKEKEMVENEKPIEHIEKAVEANEVNQVQKIQSQNEVEDAKLSNPIQSKIEEKVLTEDKAKVLQNLNELPKKTELEHPPAILTESKSLKVPEVGEQVIDGNVEVKSAQFPAPVELADPQLKKEPDSKTAEQNHNVDIAQNNIPPNPVILQVDDIPKVVSESINLKKVDREM